VSVIGIGPWDRYSGLSCGWSEDITFDFCGVPRG
jgi:hypothetical protein